MPGPDSDERVVAEFRANGGVVAGLAGGVLLLHLTAAGGPRVVPVAAALEGGSWLVAAAEGLEDRTWPADLREQPDAAVETARGSLDVLAIELEDDEARDALSRFDGPARRPPVFRLEPRG